jgi:zinc/manganese transport system permease protein
VPEFLQHALIAGTFVALACGVGGWFAVLRGQMFAGDALSHAAFPGALAAASLGIDARAGLFVATVLVGLGIGALVRATRAAHGGGSAAAGDAAIGIVFTFTLGLGAFFLARLSMSAAGGSGIEGARTLFGSIFGLSGGEALLAAASALAATVLLVVIARPLLFASLAPEMASALGVRTRLLGVVYLGLLGVIAACATQAVGALLLLGLLAAPAASAHRLARGPALGIALSAALAVVAMWSGIGLAYEIPALPPGSAIIACAVAIQLTATVAS